MPGQAELFEQSLHMVFHLLEGCVRVFGALDADDFDFVKLVQTVEAAYILAVASGFATPAGAVSTVLDRQTVGGNDYIAIEVGDGDFGSGDEV